MTITETLTLTVETMGITDGAGIDCAEVRIESASRLVSKGRCYRREMSLESSVARALEGAVGGALLAGVPVEALLAVAERVHADDETWSAAEDRDGVWSVVTREYEVRSIAAADPSLTEDA